MYYFALVCSRPIDRTIRYRRRFQQLDEWRTKLFCPEHAIQCGRQDVTKDRESDKRRRKRRDEKKTSRSKFMKKARSVALTAGNAASSGTIFCWTQVPACSARDSVEPTSGEIMYGSSALAAISYISILQCFNDAWLCLWTRMFVSRMRWLLFVVVLFWLLSDESQSWSHITSRFFKK